MPPKSAVTKIPKDPAKKENKQHSDMTASAAVADAVDDTQGFEYPHIDLGIVGLSGIAKQDASTK